MMTQFKEIVSRETKRLNIPLDAQAVDRFALYAQMLTEKNKVMNLTAITDEKGIALKHFTDSLTVLTAVDVQQGARVMDIGTGAGFPGVVLLIARPDIRLTLLDSTKKKLDFISEVLESCGLHAEILHARAEQAGKEKAHRETYDLVTARAVSNLRELSEYCLPFVKKGGIFLSMKGAKAAQEIQEADFAIKTLGGEIESTKTVEIEDCGERSLILIKKISQTSSKFPRIGTQIAKQPLIG